MTTIRTDWTRDEIAALFEKLGLVPLEGEEPARIEQIAAE